MKLFFSHRGSHAALHTLLALLLTGILGAMPASAQQSPASPATTTASAPEAAGDSSKAPLTGPPYRLSYLRHGWSAEGQLVLAINFESISKPLSLGSLKAGGKMDIFTMAASYLEDYYTHKKIAAYPRLPKKPFFGSMAGTITLSPRDSLVFGVAYPAPPVPPPGKDGLPQPYRFIFHHPSLEPFEFTFPFEKAPKPAAL